MGGKRRPAEPQHQRRQTSTPGALQKYLRSAGSRAVETSRPRGAGQEHSAPPKGPAPSPPSAALMSGGRSGAQRSSPGQRTAELSGRREEAPACAAATTIAQLEVGKMADAARAGLAAAPQVPPAAVTPPQQQPLARVGSPNEGGISGGGLDTEGDIAATTLLPAPLSSHIVGPSLTPAGWKPQGSMLHASQLKGLNPLDTVPISPAGSTSSATSDPISELKLRLSAIPTKEDMEGYIHRLESTYKSELQSITANVSQLSDQVLRLDDEAATLGDQQRSHSLTLDQHTQQIRMLLNIAEDQENRNRRNNIRLRGIPESVMPAQIITVIQQMFAQLLGADGDTTIAIDRAHRTLGPRNPDPGRPRDIICRLHYFTVKEDIMRRARAHGDVMFEGVKVQFLADLSRMTLEKRRAMRPLLEELKAHNLQYSWGYPFQVQVRLNGTLYFARDPHDLPRFCDALGLPQITISDWPYTAVMQYTQRQRRRGRSPASPDRRMGRGLDNPNEH